MTKKTAIWVGPGDLPYNWVITLKSVRGTRNKIQGRCAKVVWALSGISSRWINEELS